MNGGPFKPRQRRMGIHFRLGPDEPGFIIGGIHCRLLHRFGKSFVVLEFRRAAYKYFAMYARIVICHWTRQHEAQTVLL